MSPRPETDSERPEGRRVAWGIRAMRLARKSAIAGYLACLAILTAAACASPDTRTARADDGTPEQAAADERFYLKPFHAIIRDHREVGTHIDGPRCPMYPSCAAYADRIIREDGFSGLLLFIDRLFYREFGQLSDRYMLAPRRLSRSPRYYDPVSDVLPGDGDRRPSFFREDFRQ